MVVDSAVLALSSGLEKVGKDGEGMEYGVRELVVDSSKSMDQGVNLSDLEPSFLDTPAESDNVDDAGWCTDPFGNYTPSLSYMESDVATQAVIMDQQRKIKELEGDLSCAQAEIRRLRSQARSTDGEKHRRKTESNDKKSTSRYWTSEEHQKFLEGLAKYGHKDVKAISNHVETRNATQVRTHAQKYYLRLSREQQRTDTGSPMSNPSANPNLSNPSANPNLGNPSANPNLGNPSATSNGSNGNPMGKIDLRQGSPATRKTRSPIAKP